MRCTNRAAAHYVILSSFLSLATCCPHPYNTAGTHSCLTAQHLVPHPYNTAGTHSCLTAQHPVPHPYNTAGTHNRLTAHHSTLTAGHSSDFSEYSCDVSPILNSHVTWGSSVGIVTGLGAVWPRNTGLGSLEGHGPFCGLWDLPAFILCVPGVKRPERETDISG